MAPLNIGKFHHGGSDAARDCESAYRGIMYADGGLISTDDYTLIVADNSRFELLNPFFHIIQLFIFHIIFRTLDQWNFYTEEILIQINTNFNVNCLEQFYIRKFYT